MKDATFQDREKALEQICIDVDYVNLLNIYGESGIGKSRLLREATQQLKTAKPSSMVLYVDLSTISTDQPEAILRTLIDQGQLNVSKRDVGSVAGEIVVQLSVLAGHTPVYLMFDTTEVHQENMDFWRWMEMHLVAPLAIEGLVRQVFAGRVPVPWRRVEVRRVVKLLPLDPLPLEKDAKNLVQEILEEKNPPLKDDESLEDAVNLVLDFSFGHPALSEELATYMASHWPPSSPHNFKGNLCTEVVRPFIEERFLKDIIDPWDKILWWASVLNWFDPTILQRYLNIVAPELVRDERDYFYIQGITRLRVHNTVVWREERGDRLHGVIRNIMRHCFEVMEPEQYRQACDGATAIMEALAKEFLEEETEAQQFLQEAEIYRQRVEKEVGK